MPQFSQNINKLNKFVYLWTYLRHSLFVFTQTKRMTFPEYIHLPFSFSLVTGLQQFSLVTLVKPIRYSRYILFGRFSMFQISEKLYILVIKHNKCI